jgi:ubiquinone/menaquinone biosynthesis C-methylase UbiE
MSFSNLSGRFQSAAVLYDRYRLSYPDRLIARLAGLAGLGPGDAVLDLGCGTGMLAVAFAKIGMAVTAMDPQSEMLAAAGTAAQAAQVAVALVKGGSQDLTRQMGPFRLVVMGRSFHWMDRAATLAMLDKIVVPDGGVALFHDAHPPLAENGWFKTLCELQDKYRQTMPGDRRGGHRRYEPFLLESAFTQIDGLSVTIRQPLMLEEIVGRAFSMSACAPQMLGEACEEFAARLSSALREVSPDGKFIEVAEMVAVLARRANT